MDWKQEIFRALILTLGIMQVMTNFIYITRKNGITLARKQHTEIPSHVSDKQMK